MQIYGVDLELWLALLVAVSALAVWALKRYELVMADGKVSIKEVIGTIEGSEDLIDNVVDKAEDIEKARAARKCGVCGEPGHDRRKCPQNE